MWIIHVFPGKLSLPFPLNHHTDGSNQQYSPQCRRMGAADKVVATNVWPGWLSPFWNFHLQFWNCRKKVSPFHVFPGHGTVELQDAVRWG